MLDVSFPKCRVVKKYKADIYRVNTMIYYKIEYIAHQGCCAVKSVTLLLEYII